MVQALQRREEQRQKEEEEQERLPKWSLLSLFHLCEEHKKVLEDAKRMAHG